MSKERITLNTVYDRGPGSVQDKVQYGCHDGGLALDPERHRWDSHTARSLHSAAGLSKEIAVVAAVYSTGARRVFFPRVTVNR